MIPLAARIGCVPYLNARPLIASTPGPICLASPASLSELFRQGALDVALLPVAAALSMKHCAFVDGVAIGCDGPVFSVVLECRVPIDAAETIALDPASRSSSALAQILCRELWGRESLRISQPPADIELIIGDPAIRRRLENPRGVFLDLGAAWKELTGLPFVFALWVVRRDLPRGPDVAAWLRAIAAEGLRRRRELAAEQDDFEPELAEAYLTSHIRYDLKRDQKQAIDLYAGKLGLDAPPLWL